MYLLTLFLLLLTALILYVLNKTNTGVVRARFSKIKIYNVNNLFANNFIDSQVLFAANFNALANVCLIKNIDTSKAYTLIMENFEKEITAVHQYNTFDYSEKRSLFNVTIFVLKDKRVIELGYDYAEVLYTGKQSDWAGRLLKELAKSKNTERTQVLGFARPEVVN